MGAAVVAGEGGGAEGASVLDTLLAQLGQSGALETLGAYSMGGKLAHPFTAHPKVCPVTGEMMFFGYRFDAKPYCRYSVVNAQGDLVRTVDVGLPRPIMMHDFAVTTRHSGHSIVLKSVQNILKYTQNIAKSP